MIISMVIALGVNNEIGLEGKLPWRLPEDLKQFKKITKGGVVIMGAKTWESLGCKPLPGRVNIVMTKNNRDRLHDKACSELGSGMELVSFVGSIDECMSQCRDRFRVKDTDEVFVIGGAEIYRLFTPFYNRVYLSRVAYSDKADTYMDLSFLFNNMKANEKSAYWENCIFKEFPKTESTLHWEFHLWQKVIPFKGEL